MRKEIEDLFEVESLINFSKIEQILNNNKGKKIFCFGGGSAAEILMNQLLFKYDIEGFLDNNSLLWDKKIHGVRIRNPKEVLNFNKEDIFVIILSKHLKAISEELDGMGLEVGKNYIDIYQSFASYFRTKKFQASAEKYLDFIDKVTKEDFKMTRESEHIGVVCITSMVDWETWYPITIFLILKSMGYNATLIMDNMYSFDDVIYFEEHAITAKKYSDYIINYLLEKIPDLDIRFLDKSKKSNLDKQDFAEIDRLVELNLLWQNAKYDEMDNVEFEKREKIFKNVLVENEKVIKAFFAENKFDSLNVITALHKSRGLYMWEGKRYNMRVSSYDGAGLDMGSLYTTDYPCSHAYDISKVINEKMLDDKLRDIIIKLAKEDFNNRINATSSDKGYNFQPVSNVNKSQRFYDVIIPLNVNCDGAGIGLNCAFANEMEWIYSTIDYIIENTDASIMVREHPAIASCDWVECRLDSYGDEIDRRYGKTGRVYFCQASEKINTYRMIEKCKVVLPYSSTIGVEAVLLGKKVITHTKVYYSLLDFIYSAKTKDEYFSLIKGAVDGSIIEKKYDVGDAYIAYFGLRKLIAETEFRETTDVWMKYSLKELLEVEGVKDMMAAFAEKVPLNYANFLKCR